MMLKIYTVLVFLDGLTRNDGLGGLAGGVVELFLDGRGGGTSSRIVLRESNTSA